MPTLLLLRQHTRASAQRRAFVMLLRTLRSFQLKFAEEKLRVARGKLQGKIRKSLSGVRKRAAPPWVKSQSGLGHLNPRPRLRRPWPSDRAAPPGAPGPFVGFPELQKLTALFHCCGFLHLSAREGWCNLPLLSKCRAANCDRHCGSQTRPCHAESSGVTPVLTPELARFSENYCGRHPLSRK